MMRSVLLYVHDDDCFEARLQAALDICRQFDGHLTCLQAIPFDIGIAGDLYYPVGAQVARDLRQDAQEFRKLIEPRLSGGDVPWHWIYTDGLAASQIPRHTPLSDLLVVGSHNPTGGKKSPSKLVSDLVLQVRPPILVVPPAMKRLQLDQPAAIAWNGSPEGAHALRSAMPLLVKASQVFILTAAERKADTESDLPPTGAAHYLARYGIEAEMIELPVNSGSSIAGTLSAAAKLREAAYLVMGAYGHSRFRERILGGVTREMLSDPQLPLLLSH